MASAHSWLITGFEPFGTHTYNPSAHVATQLALALRHAGARCEHLVLPVTFACAEAFAHAHISRADTILIHIGLAADRAHISLEQRAKNSHGITPDNLGQIPSSSRLLQQDAPPERTSALDLIALQRAITRADTHRSLPEVRITQDAGSYVCNAIYYHSLTHTPHCLFIHVPDWNPQQAEHFAHILSEALLATH